MAISSLGMLFHVQSRTGPITKRTVVDARRAWVLEQHVYDAAGKPLASAIARSHQYYEQAGVSLPREVDVKIPGNDLSLSIDLGTLEVNTLVENPQLWELPAIAGSPPHDLGAVSASGDVPVIGQQLSQADWYGPGPAGGSPPTIFSGAPAPLAVAIAQPSQDNITSQFIPPGGTAPLDAGLPPSQPLGAQRLPPGGIATQPVIAR